MSWLWLLYLIPLLVVSVASLTTPLYYKAATRGAVLAGLVIAVIPLLNVFAMFTLIFATTASQGRLIQAK